MVPTLADNILEGVKYFTAKLSLPAGQTGVVLDADVAVVEIIDNDCESFMHLILCCITICVSLSSVVTVEFDPISYTVSESVGFVNITVVKRGQTTQTVSVDFSTADGSATGEKQLWSA